MALAFGIHQIPAFILIAALILAWRWGWIGTALYAAAVSHYIIGVVSMSRRVPPATRLIWIITIAGPAFTIAGLFLANWLKHGELHADRR
jgi:hypothetical protein